MKKKLGGGWEDFEDGDDSEDFEDSCRQGRHCPQSPPDSALRALPRAAALYPCFFLTLILAWVILSRKPPWVRNSFSNVLSCFWLCLLCCLLV